MSKPKKRKSHRHQEQPIDKAIQKLLLYAKKVMHGDASDDEEGKLNKLIEHHLMKKNDNILLSALSMASDKELMLWLFDEINDRSDHEFVVMKDGGYGFISIFVVPIIFRIDDEPCPAYVEDLDVLCRSFRKYGLINSNPTLLLRPELFCRDDLEMLPSQKLKTIQTHAPYFVPPHKGFPPMDVTEDSCESSYYGYADRYMLGFVVASVDDDVPFSPADNIDEFFEKGAEWSEFFAKELANQMGLDEVSARLPTSMHDAFMESEIILDRLDINAAIAAAKEDADKNKTQCQAVIGLYVDKTVSAGEIRVGFYDDAKNFLEGYVRAVGSPEESVEQLDLLAEALISGGIENITKLDEVYPMDNDAGDIKDFPLPTNVVIEISSGQTLH